MKQMARNLTDGLDGFLDGCRYLIHHRSSLFTEEFESILRTAAINSVRLPARSPNLNAMRNGSYEVSKSRAWTEGS